MKRALSTLAILFMLTIQLNAQTTIPAGDVYGVWTQANSPYLVTGDITIPADSNLMIEPGCYIAFNSYKSLTVYGSLQAIGTNTDSIYFSVESGSFAGVWSGIEFENGNDQDSSIFSYCRFENASAGSDLSGGLFKIHDSRYITISHCTISNCEAKYGGAIFLLCVGI